MSDPRVKKIANIDFFLRMRGVARKPMPARNSFNGYTVEKSGKWRQSVREGFRCQRWLNISCYCGSDCGNVFHVVIPGIVTVTF